MTDATQQERNRIRAILLAGESIGQRDLAMHLALETRLPKQEALALLHDAHKNQHRPNMLNEAMTFLGNPDLGPDSGDYSDSPEYEAARILSLMETNK